VRDNDGNELYSTTLAIGFASKGTNGTNYTLVTENVTDAWYYENDYIFKVGLFDSEGNLKPIEHIELSLLGDTTLNTAM
jgi:hypothetical protein